MLGLQLHAAVVELSAAKNADIKYSTVQNWYPGDAEGVGGIYNFVTKRALCHGANSKVSWTQVHIMVLSISGPAFLAVPTPPASLRSVMWHCDCKNFSADMAA